MRTLELVSAAGQTSLVSTWSATAWRSASVACDAMRARADLILVGSGTVLAEGYGPARTAAVWADRRPGPPPRHNPRFVTLLGTSPDAHAGFRNTGLVPLLPEHRSASDTEIKEYSELILLLID